MNALPPIPSSVSLAPLLDIRDLGVTYRRGARPALDGVSLAIGRGEAVGLIGESGSGKTTLAKTILGAVTPSTGSVRFEGEDLLAQSQRRRMAFRRAGAVRYVFQNPLDSLDPDWTVERSIAEPRVLAGGFSAAARAQAVLRAADAVALPRDLLGRRPEQLSGGQRQRVAIARALVSEPRLLIADEPVSALDSTVRAQVLELFIRLRAQAQMAFLFVSHDLGSVAALVDRIVVLYRGAIVEDGPADQVIGDPRHDYTRLLVQAAPRLRL